VAKSEWRWGVGEKVVYMVCVCDGVGMMCLRRIAAEVVATCNARCEAQRLSDWSNLFRLLGMPLP
jgi:hypothetical protein